MPTEIKKSDDSGFTIRRGPGHGYSQSFWGDNPVDKALPDKGAKISFGRPYLYQEDFRMCVHFGYISPSHKDYSRSITLDLNQTIALINYLNKSVSAYKTRGKRGTGL